MKKTVIYCANGTGQRAAYSLNDENYEIVAVVDGDSNSWGQRVICGLPTISPEDLLNIDFDIVVIASDIYEDAIKERLFSLGINEDRICVFHRTIDGEFVPDERFIMLRRCIDMILERKIKGNIAEAGVYKGDFAKYMNHFLPDRKLYLFDTFKGFVPERDTVPERALNSFKDTSVEIVLGKMVKPEQCIIKKGYFPDSAMDVCDDFCLVSLDCDLYEPTLNGLKFFYPQLVKGGYIFVHDAGNHSYPGVKKAVYEFCEETGAVCLPMMDRVLSLIIAK